MNVKQRLSILILIFLSAGPVWAGDRPYVEEPFMAWATMFNERLYEYFPTEIAKYLDSYRLCAHWGGEEAYDSDRADQIQQGITASCTNLETAEQAIMVKYAGDPKLQAMQQMKVEVDKGESTDYSFVWDDPQKQSPILNKYTESEAQGVLRNVKEQMREFDALVAKNADSQQIATIRSLLGVQKQYLHFVLSQADRLHPITRREIEALKNDKEFLKRAASL